jgi:hypothetical protein
VVEQLVELALNSSWSIFFASASLRRNNERQLEREARNRHKKERGGFLEERAFARFLVRAPVCNLKQKRESETAAGSNKKPCSKIIPSRNKPGSKLLYHEDLLEIIASTMERL